MDSVPNAKIAILVMPFFSVTRPALGASLLKATVERNGYHCDVHYLNMHLAEQIDFLEYSWIGELSPPSALLGDWLFSPWAHHKAITADTDKDASYINNILLGRYISNFTPGDVLRILRIRDSLEQYLNYCLASHDWSIYKIIGFTTTFNQNCASIAFAWLLKEKYPDIRIVFGGANCEGEMGHGLLANYDCIDAVCSGEGENAFVTYVNSILNDGITARAVGGMLVREDMSEKMLVPAIQLDTLPYPDFSDYYARFTESTFFGQFEPLVPFETSRGCWWGEKHHCTFCGLNGLNMRFRSKSQARAFEELQFLTNRWGKRILCVDNILDLEYLREFLPRLAQQHWNLELHYEVKVNLKKSQLHILASAGVCELQPGIESFITPILRMIEKGTSLLQNIQMMRWSKEIGIQVAWNLLYGFPGEDADLYGEMIELLPNLSHLDPPQHCGLVRADRHSPYFMNPARYGIDLVTEPAYSFVYTIEEKEVKRIAYYFEMRFDEKQRISEYESLLHNAINQWKNQSVNGAIFTLSATEDGVVLTDTRQKSAASYTVLSSQEAEVLLACDSIVGMQSLENLPIWEGCVNLNLTHDLVNQLKTRGWLLEEGQRFLTLPVLDASMGFFNTNRAEQRVKLNP